MKYARLVLNNLMRNRSRTALTVLSVAVSLFIFSALASLPTVANQILSQSASSVRIVCHNKAGLVYPLPEAYKQRIASTPHVEAVVAQSWFGGIYDEPSDQFPNFAFDHERVDEVWPEWFTKRGAAEFKRLRTACLVGRSLMRKFRWHVGQQIMLRGTVYPFNVTLNIVGVLGAKAPPNFLVFRRDYLEELLGRKGIVNNFWVKVDKPSSVSIVIASLDETFANSDAETQSESESAFLNSFLSNYRTLFKLAEILGLIVVATIGLVAANTAAMSIRERRVEIAVMRSMGFTGPLVLALLLAESAIIGVVGGVLGCVGAYVILKVIAVSSPALGPLGTIRMPATIVGEGLGLAALIGLFSGYVPASFAIRRRIADALRTVA
jgi:putative ABC transport system permease protein